jgi:hypothetical protein
MKNIILILLILLLIPCASAATITDGFNGSVTITDVSVSYNETVSLVEASPDWIEITITGDYPEYAAGVPYLNLKAYYELNGDAEDSTTSHDGTHTGTTAGTYDGIDDFTSIPAHSDFNFSSDFTISAQVDVDNFEQSMAVIDGESYAFRIGQDKIPYFEMIDDVTPSISSIGTPRGTSYYVNALHAYNGKLYAGLYSGYVYSWDGSSWTSCGQVSTSTTVTALAVHNGYLYAGCGSGSELSRVYRYDGGTTWTWVMTEYNGAYISSLCSYNGKLYAGNDVGEVYEIIGVDNYERLGTTVGTTSNVRAMVVYKDKLYISGSGNGVVYRWDGGSTFTSIGDIGATYHINSLVVMNDVMYASLSGSTLSGYVYKWDGVGTTTWSSCGRLGTSTELRQLCVYNGQLYGTSYTLANLYRYDGGTTWSAYALGSSTRGYSLTTYDGKLIIGGYNGGYVYTVGTGEAIYGTALTADTDTYLTAVRSGSTVTFYQNTVSKGTATASFALDTNRAIWIGRSSGSTHCGHDGYFDGEVHNVGFWSDDVEVASIISGEVGMFMKPSCDTAWVPYEGGTQLISIGTILDGVTFKNTDGGPNGVTIVEKFLYDVTTSNEINADGNYEVDIDLTTAAATSDGKIRLDVARVFTGATVTGDSTEITYGDGYLIIDTDSIAAGAYDFHIEATYDIGANSYSPSSSSISMIAMSDDSQIFTVTTNDDESHEFVWYVDKVEVESNSGLTSSYTYESGAYGSDTIKVVIDDSVVHTWTVVNGLNTTATTKSLTSLNENLSLEFKSISDYKGFDKIFAADTENTSSLLDAAFIPVNSYWADDDLGLGVWFYPVLIILLAGGVYIKTKQLETTSITILILTMLIAAPATAGTIHVPTAFLWMMYLLAAFSVLGVFAGLLFRRG